MRSEYRSLFVKMFKYVPPVSVLVLTVHTLLLLCGYEFPFTLFIVDSSFLGGSLLLASSVLFDMCKLHKACIWYTVIVTLIMDLKKITHFGLFLLPLRFLVFIIGLILTILCIIRYIKQRL